MAKLTVINNGPLYIEGEFQVTDSNGNTFKVDKPKVALCRCGLSDNKPFCDGQHRVAGFKSEVKAE